MTGRDPRERLKDHEYGSNKWSKENKPFDLIYFEKYFCKRDATERERFYKTGFGRVIRNSILKAVINLKR